MAKLLESHIRSDPHFEVPAERHLGLVVFCLKVLNTILKYLSSKLYQCFIYVFHLLIITNYPVTPCSKVNNFQ